VRLTSILTTEDTLSMTHHNCENVGRYPSHVTPDRQSGSLCTGSYSLQAVSKVLILTKKEPRQMCIWWRMGARKFKIWMNT